MASKSVVYVAVVCVSCIAFCTVDSCRKRRKPINCLVGYYYPIEKNGKCGVYECTGYEYRYVHKGCDFNGPCYMKGQKANGKTCTRAGTWT
ncbi:hypothetical protein PoB_000138700 [Plakobranchus ocellatus]|uniref:Uncharacterized protein n=1 Tax=Plakobranchus ocellatus TaxID=259542 RepID=A0AAV3XWP1_9GAST|nr:hypothetical protein PoB_000138700 [Plakobranchus ocellatus]